MKTVTNPLLYTVRAVSDCGTHICPVGASVTRVIPDACFADACARGCVPADPAVDNPATELDESRVVMLESLIHGILDEGDPSLLTMDGCPKASEIKKRFGKHTTPEREQAWDNVKQSRDLD